MGWRTLVLFSNDRCSEWQHDPLLGQKIAYGMNSTHDKSLDSMANLSYGRVVQCAHADDQTLAVIDHYDFKPIGYGMWGRDETPEQRDLKLLRDAADRLGYTLTKKRVRK